VIQAPVLDLSESQFRDLCSDCEAVVSCLGHTMDFQGIFGHPRQLCTEAIRRSYKAICDNKTAQQTKVILMNTVGVRHPSSDKKRSLFERFILTLLRHTTPPHRDNETAAAFLVEEIAENIGEVEWCIVRPDTLINGPVSDYEIVPAPTTGIFSGRPTTRANVAHFMKTLLEDRELWAEWKFNAPVIMNDN
jgi:hypothetical protein